jgi:hypothetical protein
MGHVKMAGRGFVNDVTAWWPGFVVIFMRNRVKPNINAFLFHFPLN